MNQDTLRVGYVVKRYPRFSETFIVNEILAHEAAGHSVEIFSLYPPCDTHFQDIISKVRAPVTYLHAEGLRSADFWSGLQETSREFPGFWSRLEDADSASARELFQAAWLARLVRERGLDHLHAHFASCATAVARLAARFADIPFSFTAHAKDIFHKDVDPGQLRPKLADAAAVITVSDFNVKFLQGRYGEAASRVRRIYNGVHLDRFPFTPPSERRRRIVGVGRLVEKKGFDVLIEAAALLDKARVDFTCDIIGTGEMEGTLKAMIQNLNLSHRVRLLGALPQAEVIRELQDAAVCAAPCVVGQDNNTDGLPTVLLEAMALGTPCVATDVTGIPEIIQHEETGLLVEQHDPETLACALQRLMGDAGLRTRLAATARQLIEREFDAKQNSQRQFSIFLSCREGHRSAEPGRPGQLCGQQRINAEVA